MEIFINFFIIVGLFRPIFSETHYLDDVGLNVKQLIIKYGYPLESHTVITKDGYILKAHRIPYGRNGNGHSNTTRPPVLLIPGVLCSSADWIANGPKNGLGFILADAGYDVWLGNVRGTTWSRRHVSLNPDKDKKYWNYSAHEIGIYDVASFIDYILFETKEPNLFYIGHSQGGNVVYILTSERPEYNKKIRLMSLLSPAGFYQNGKSIFFPIVIAYLTELLDVVEKHHIIEFLPQTPFTQLMLPTLCSPDSDMRFICYFVLLSMSGLAPEQINKNRLPVIGSNFPSGTSPKVLLYYLQLKSVDKLFKFDYGAEENLKQYGQRVPPIYNVTATTAPAVFYAGDKDLIIDYKDTLALADMFPNAVAKIVIKNFGHADFVWGRKARSVLYNDILNRMQHY